MDRDQYRDQFLLFSLPINATIEDLDRKYSAYTARLDRQSRSEQENPEVVKKRRREVDEAYQVLLRYFMWEDSQRGSKEPRHVFTMQEIVNKTYEACPVQRPSIKEADDPADCDRGSVRDARQSIDGGPSTQDFTLFPTSDVKRSHRARTPPALATRDNTVRVGRGGGDDDGNDSKKRTRSDFEDASDDSASSEGSIEASDLKSFRPIECEGDIFDAPDRAVIIHAVNCQGVWGAGFAAQVRERYPESHELYKSYCCEAADQQEPLEAECLLIPPQDVKPNQRRHWIACLFTSDGYGSGSTNNPGKGSAYKILANTDLALSRLRLLISDLRADPECPHVKPGALYSPKINAGFFGIPWHMTRDIICQRFAGYEGTWTVISPPAKQGRVKTKVLDPQT